MSSHKDPIRSRLDSSTRIGGDPIPKNQGGGSINTDRMYFSSIQSFRARLLFAFICLLPYISLSIYLHIVGYWAIASILMLTLIIPSAVIWFVVKRTK